MHRATSLMTKQVEKRFKADVTCPLQAIPLSSGIIEIDNVLPTMDIKDEETYEFVR